MYSCFVVCPFFSSTVRLSSLSPTKLLESVHFFLYTHSHQAHTFFIVVSVVQCVLHGNLWVQNNREQRRFFFYYLQIRQVLNVEDALCLCMDLKSEKIWVKIFTCIFSFSFPHRKCTPETEHRLWKLYGVQQSIIFLYKAYWTANKLFYTNFSWWHWNHMCRHTFGRKTFTQCRMCEPQHANRLFSLGSLQFDTKALSFFLLSQCQYSGSLRAAQVRVERRVKSMETAK